MQGKRKWLEDTHIYKRILRCNGRNPSRNGENHLEAGERGFGAGRTHPAGGESGSVVGENHSAAGKIRSVAGESHSAAGKSGSVALQRHFLPLHPLIFREILPSTQCIRI